jgi:phage gpG-like protein
VLSYDARVQEVQERLRSTTDQAKLTKALGALGRVLVNRIRIGFSRGVSPEGLPWKRPQFRTGQPLVDTSRLRNSFTHKVVGNEVTVGTDVLYARVHQFGAIIRPLPGPGLTARGRLLAFPGPNGVTIFAKQVTIPARKFMPLDATGNVKLPAPWARSALDALAKALEI